jgi:glycosyltransferase involved in cell wall biosynthesis
VHIRVSKAGALGTMEFDAFSVKHACLEQSIKLVLGYNTGIFTLALRLKGHAVITNMDGIEWKRSKWSWKARAWFYVNEWASALISNKMIADHPEIANHLSYRRSRSKTVMIPYGADPVTEACSKPILQMGLQPNGYFISIARIEKENSILEMIKAFSAKRRDMKFVVLGKFEENNAYHNAIKQAASDEVLFVGAIYNQRLVQALRFHARAYCHGHTVGGTNPSLVESLMAGNAVIAHDNKFNRWTAGQDQFFFSNTNECEKHFDTLSKSQILVDAAKISAQLRASEAFQWEQVLSKYEETLLAYV